MSVIIETPRIGVVRGVDGFSLYGRAGVLWG